MADQDISWYGFTYSVLADMDASDTALCNLQISNDGGAQADVKTGSYFSGFLAC